MLGFLDDIFCRIEGKPTRAQRERQPKKIRTFKKKGIRGKKQGLGFLLYKLFVSKEYQDKGLAGWKDDKEKFKIDLINDIKNFLFTKWEKPWVPGLVFDMQNKVISGFRNITGRVYHNGSNVIALQQNAGDSPFFITLAMLKSKGGKILDKTKITSVISFIPIFKEKTVSGTDDRRKPDYMLPQFHPVINVDFTEGIKKPVYKTIEFINHELNEYVEAFINELKKRKRIPTLIYDQADGCFYKYSLMGGAIDEIHLVNIGQFKKINEYYSTLFHEIVHSTKHESRLNGRGKKGIKGIDYANEELVAEMGAMIICSELGLEYSRQNSLTYLKGWLSQTKGNADDAMIEAYAFACDAAEYLLEGIDLEKLVPKTMINRVESADTQTHHNPSYDVPEKPDAKAETPKKEQEPEVEQEKTLLPRTKPDELSYDLAYRAHTGTSFSPEKRAKAHQEDYAETLNDYAEKFEKLAKTDEQKELLKAEFARFKDGYKNKYTAWLRAKSNCISTMITGPANFPVRRAEKANQTEHNRSVELTDFESRAEKAIINKLQSARPQEVKDSEAWAKVYKKVMADISNIVGISKGKPGFNYNKAAFVNSLKGFLTTLHKNGLFAYVNKALALVREAQEAEKVVIFAPNNAVWQLENTTPAEKEVNVEVETIYNVKGCKVVNNRPDERVRIFMDEKPSSEIITVLKKRAFKWSPSNKAWQRQNTPNGVNEAVRFAKEYLSDCEKAKPEKPTAKQSDKVEIEDFPIKYIQTDEKRFQNRKGAFSEDSKNRIINAVKNGTFDWSKFDPIVIWKNVIHGTYYFVLSGHSRLAAFKELHAQGITYKGFDFSTIPAKQFLGSEKQAIELALNSNTLSTKETDVERAMYYNKQRGACEYKNLKGLGAKTDCEKEIETQCREAEGKNANFILNLSYLNPDGYLIDSLARLGAEKDNDNTNVLRTIANWIGEARRDNPGITNAQEKEIALFLMNGGYGNKAGQFRNKQAFNDRLKYSWDRWKSKGADPNENLNLANTLSKSSFEKEYDERLEKAKKAYDQAVSDHEEKHKKYLLAVMDGNLTHNRMNELMQPVVSWVERTRKEYEQVRGGKEEFKKAAQAQTSLWGFGRIDKAKNAKTYKLDGDLGKFIGGYEKMNYSIVLRGDKGAGKSRLLYQLLNCFASKGLKVGFLSLEMASGSSVSQRYRNEYINPKNMARIDISDQPLDYDSLNSICKLYDVVAVDSWTKLRALKQEDFDRLQKENPQTILLVIFQSTTGKVTRGGNMPEFDAAIVIHVHEGGLAVCEKNRYQATDLEYNVFKKALVINEPASVEKEG